MFTEKSLHFFSGFLFAKCSNQTIKASFCASSCSEDINASPINLSCVMNYWSYVFMNFSIEMLLSRDALNTGNVRRLRNSAYKLDKFSSKTDSKIKLRMPFWVDRLVTRLEIA